MEMVGPGPGGQGAHWVALAGVGASALLAFAVWSQRASLQDCADKVQANYERVGTNVSFLDTDCSFFGVTVTISDPRNDDPADDSE